MLKTGYLWIMVQCIVNAKANFLSQTFPSISNLFLTSELDHPYHFNVSIPSVGNRILSCNFS